MINKILITLSVICCLIKTVSGQTRIENKLNETYLNIKGTKISLVPPAGFTSGTNFLGIQQTESGSSIMITNIPGPYSEVSKGITKENMLTKGVEINTIEKFIINDYPALFASGIQSYQGQIYTKYILIFGTEEESIMMSGACIQSLAKISESMKKSMLTAYYEPGKKVDVFEVLDYSIDVSGTKLQFSKSMGNALMYTVDGKTPTLSADKTNLLVAKSISEVTEQDTKLYSLNVLKQTPIQIITIEYTKEISMDGISGYEILATGKYKTGETEKVYQVMLFSDHMYYRFFATTNDMTTKSLEEIKKAVLTFKRK